MGKLLVWRATVFLLRYEQGKLTIQRVDVDATDKKVSLHPCDVSLAEKSTAIPADARLVAAQEVEDSVLAIRYPVLIFQSAAEVSELSTSGNSPSRKRRRFVNSSEKLSSNSSPEASSKTEGQLFFYILYEKEDKELSIQLLNVLETPLSSDAEELQVFVTDGPFVLLFDRSAQSTVALKLQRSRTGGKEGGFYVWREGVDVTSGTETEVVVVSCTYVSETHSSRPHILIHTKILPPSDSTDHIWSVLNTDDDRAAKEIVTQCAYTRALSCTDVELGTTRNLEQVTCCCFISEISDRDFSTPALSETAMFTTWTRGTSRYQRTELNSSTLLVTGTSSRSVCVYTNGILVTSTVLPAQPADMWCMCNNVEQQSYVLGVRCADADRSFFILKFSSSVHNAAMELLVSFNHVGHALVGEFCQPMAPSALVLNQVILLNDVATFADTVGDWVASKEECLDDSQLVKRSVLVVQKLAAPETKLSCHRLRLREDKKSKNTRKRSRNVMKTSTSGEAAGGKPFHYIERTQRASSRSRAVDVAEEEGGDNTMISASHAQLAKLVNSLSIRLDCGIKELKRLQLIVNDKTSLVHQLDQLIIRQWQRQQQSQTPVSEKSAVASLAHITETIGYSPTNQASLNMETLVSFSSSRLNLIGDVDGTPTGQSAAFSASDQKLQLQVTLEEFQVIEYVPSASLVRTKIVLRAHSPTGLKDSFVTLSPPQGRCTAQGWTCSCSVLPTFGFEEGKAKQSGTGSDGRAHFQLELQFAPYFKFLRMRNSLEATLWLHWNASCDESGSFTFTDWCPSRSGLAIASVTLDPPVIVQAGKEMSYSDDALLARQEHSELLVLSSGSSLTPWAENQRHNLPSSVQHAGGSNGRFLRPIVVRPTFAVLRLMARERELALYELSRMTATLPPDVYVMLNPFQQAHVDALQRVLHAMRSELLEYKGSSSTITAAIIGESGARTKEKQAATGRRSSTQRAMQRETDLLVHQLLQTLQKRVNFHTMWFDITARKMQSKNDKMQ